MPLSKAIRSGLFVAMILSAPHAAADPIPPRAALGLFLPSALKVVEDIEEELGTRYSDTELERILRSPEFQERFQLETLSDTLTWRCSRVACTEA